MNTSTTRLLASGVLLAVAIAYGGSVPGEMNYQGQIRTATGDPLADGNYKMTFTIYDAPDGGSAEWGPYTNSSVAVVEGSFNVVLPAQDPFSRKLLEAVAESSRFLELQVGDNPAIAPRQELLSAPYSLNAEHSLNAERLQGHDWSAFFDNGSPATGKIPGGRIADASISAGQLANNAVTSAKIQNGQVTRDDIADNTIDGAKITDGTIANSDLADDAVTSGKIADGTIANSDFANSSVTSAKIMDGSVTTADIANGTITGADLADGAVTSGKIYDGSVTTVDLANDSVTSAKIMDGSVTTADIANGTIIGLDIADGTINGTDIADGGISSWDIANETIRGVNIYNKTITRSHIQDGTITSEQLDSKAVTSDKIAFHAIGASHFLLPLYLDRNGAGPTLRVDNDSDDAIYAWNAGSHSAIHGTASTAGGYGLSAHAWNGATALYCRDMSGTGYAGEFLGKVRVTGTLTKPGGSFKIDHPLDPTNKYLSHSFVESPDMKNIYDGVVVLDVRGEATVALPEWFDALNKDFRYQLTAIGAAAPNLHIAQKLSGNSFKIAGGREGLEVSWQITGIRRDAWANAHRIVVEEEKPPSERGLYLTPEVFNEPKEKGIFYEASDLQPEGMQ